MTHYHPNSSSQNQQERAVLSSDAPVTYLHSPEGRVIDGIWATPGIQVERCGYLAPGQAQSNHSLLWIDVSFESALGHDPPLPQTPDARRLQLANSKTTEKYLNVYEKEITKHDLPRRQFKLAAETTYGQPLSPRQTQEAEAIHHTRTKCMHKAERKCRKLNMGAVDFSPAIAKPLVEIVFWDIAIKRKFPPPESAAQRERRLSRANPRRRRKQISSRLWRRAKKTAKITKPTKDMSKEEMMAERKKAKKEYKTAKKNHRKLRWSFLDTLAPKDRDRIKRTEEQRSLGRLAKRISGKSASFSVTMVKHNGTDLTLQRDVEETLLTVNHGKGRASDDTTFLMEPKLSEFGLRCETPASQQVLDGTDMPTPDTTEPARKFLRNAAIEARYRSIKPRFRPRRRITTDDHIRGFKKTKGRERQQACQASTTECSKPTSNDVT